MGGSSHFGLKGRQVIEACARCVGLAFNNMAQYGKSEYWEERYTRDPEPFDWYQRWAGLKDTLLKYLEHTSAILMLGAGNSRLSEEMWEEGLHNITNIDISMVVTKAMTEKYRDKSGMSC